MAENLEKIEDKTDFTAPQAPNIAEREMTPWVFANDKTNPAPFGILNMFYSGVFSNTLGIMVAKNTETGLEDAVLVGLDRDENGELGVYPIAVVLSKEDSIKFLPPDGNGGYVDYRKPE